MNLWDAISELDQTHHIAEHGRLFCKTHQTSNFQFEQVHLWRTIEILLDIENITDSAKLYVE